MERITKIVNGYLMWADEDPQGVAATELFPEAAELQEMAEVENWEARDYLTSLGLN